MTELNQSCPCKSGLKYQDCCLPLQDLIEFLPSTGICQDFKVYNERYVLSNLLKKSKEFEAFYNSERSEILNQIVWGVDPSLAAGMRIGFFQEFNINLIVLKKAPIDVEDALDTAHELMHFILGQKGFPLAYISQEGLLNGYDARFAGILLNIVMNPLVSSKLSEFGFNLWSYYDKASQVQRNYRETTEQPPMSDRYKYYEVAFYIQKVLDWEIAQKHFPRPQNDFLEWYRSKYPEVVQEAAIIIDEIRQNGIDTPHKARKILTKLIKKYDMGSIVMLE